MKSQILSNADTALDSDTIVFRFQHKMNEDATIIIRLG